jgi:hypothetical protein
MAYDFADEGSVIYSLPVAETGSMNCGATSETKASSASQSTGGRMAMFNRVASASAYRAMRSIASCGEPVS